MPYRLLTYKIRLCIADKCGKMKMVSYGRGLLFRDVRTFVWDGIITDELFAENKIKNWNARREKK